MGKKYKFEIGDLVVTDFRAEMGYDPINFTNFDKPPPDEKKLQVIQLPEPMIGKICGMCRKFFGKYHPENSHTSDYGTSNYYGRGDDYYPAYLEVMGSVLLYEIKPGMLNRPIEVLEEHITKLGLFTYQFPLKFYPTFEKDKERLRNESKNWPRDEKGRWK